MDKWVRLSIIAGVLMAGFGVFYHFVVFLPALEREKLEASRILAEQNRERESSRTAAYNECMYTAKKNQLDYWSKQCAELAKDTTQKLKSCRKMYNGDSNYCDQLHGKPDASPSCGLPKSYADFATAYLREEEEKCLEVAKLGL
jgi:hypothetical protein